MLKLQSIADIGLRVSTSYDKDTACVGMQESRSFKPVWASGRSPAESSSAFNRSEAGGGRSPLQAGFEMKKLRMLNHLETLCTRRVPAVHLYALIAISVLAVWLAQSACFFKKSKVEPVTISPTRLVLMPFNVPAGDNDLRWAALAAPILMAKESERAEAIELVPFWQPISRVGFRPNGLCWEN
jgi:hypothetical protein